MRLLKLTYILGFLYVSYSGSQILIDNTVPEYPILPYAEPNTTSRVINKDGQYLLIPPNIRPFPHITSQAEVTAAGMKGNSQIICAAWNSYGIEFYGAGFCISTNGGNNWSGSYQTFRPNSGCPALWIWPGFSSWQGRLGLTAINGQGYSSNFGSSWVAGQQFSSSFDFHSSAVDDISGSPFAARAYTLWIASGGDYANRVVISYTTNGGLSWSIHTPVSPVPSQGHIHRGCDVKAGPGGIVYVVWANCISSGENSTEDYLGFAKSTDGGNTWINVNDFAVDINGIRTSGLVNGIKANGFPKLAVDNTGGPRNGWLYAALGEKTISPATDPADMCLCRSTNGGLNWTHTRINQDLPGSGKLQYHGDIDVAPDGSVVCSYFDQRNTTSPVTEYWMSRSLNGGDNWVDAAVSDHSFTPEPVQGIPGGFGGEFTGITTAAGKIWPFWYDNSTGIFQVWTAGISYGPLPANDIAVGPWLGLPAQFNIGVSCNIKARFTNNGTSIQTNIPAVFSVNGSVFSFDTIPLLNPGVSDSVSFSWMPQVQGTYNLRVYSALYNDQNRLNDTIGLHVVAIPEGTVILQNQFCRSGINIEIPVEGDALPDSILINISNALYVTDVNVTLDTVIHGWIPSLSFRLSHLNVQYLAFMNCVGSFGENIFQCTLNDSASLPITSGYAPYLGTWKPSNPLTPFNNMPVNGWWRLDINDNGPPFWVGPGELHKWCLQVTYQTLIGGIQTVEVPNYFYLGQNYPNPFNPVTVIKYGIPVKDNVYIKIYNILGNEIEIFSFQNQQPGTYSVQFDASKLPSGVYFYRLLTKNFSETRKMIVVK